MTGPRLVAKHSVLGPDLAALFCLGSAYIHWNILVPLENSTPMGLFYCLAFRRRASKPITNITCILLLGGGATW